MTKEYAFTIGHGRTVNRLTIYRKKAQECRDDYKPGKDWRYWKRNIWSTPSNVTREGKLFSDSVDQVGEYLGDAHKLTRLNHTGWYVDDNYSGLMIGGVCRMRSPRGVLYIPVTYCDEWDGSTHYIGDAILVPKGSDEEDHDEAIRDAAARADGCAEREAEEAREGYAKDRAELDVQEARAEIHAINKKVIALIREIKSSGTFTPAVCGALREKLADYLAERRKQFEIIAAREKDYWSACSWY